MAKPMTVRKNGNSCVIRWKYKGESFSITHYPFDNEGRSRMALIASDIQRDIDLGRFDKSLKRYKSWEVEEEKQEKEKKKLKNILDYWDEWISNTPRLTPTTIECCLRYIKSSLEKFAHSINEDVLKSPEFEAYCWREWKSGETYNKRKGYLKKFLQYLVKRELITRNYIDDWERKPVERVKPKPFSNEEMTAIFKYMGLHKDLSVYLYVIFFRFYTGVRIQEAFGLKWKYIDFKKREIAIEEVSARNNQGNSSRRIQKEPKTKKTRTLKMSEGTFKILSSLKRDDCKPDDLVFPSPNGLPIDDRNFNKRVWKKTLKELNIEYRSFNKLRHTFTHRALTQTRDPMAVAAQLGHSNLSTMFRNYGDVIGSKEAIEIKLDMTDVSTEL